MIKRILFSDLKEHLFKKEISFIVGPRQAGKTTLMLLLKEYLEREGEKTLFLNLDVETDKRFFSSQENMISKIKLELGESRGFIFIDEIQRKEDAGVFLKGIYDQNLPYKLIVSGSGSVELKEKIQESLMGRKRMFLLSVISFREFVDYRTDYKYKDNFVEYFKVENIKANQLTEEYLNFGGYPRLISAGSLKEKKHIINEIYQSYIEKDISYLLNIRKTDDFSALVKVLAGQIGQLINVSEISRTLGISQDTVKNYLWYLQKTFILDRVSPYFKNVRKEISKAPVFYFFDLGLRNFAVDIFGNANILKDKGFIFQNFVFNIFKEKLQDSSAKIHFWRTKDGAEIDFILDKGQAQIPIEVKYAVLKNPKLMRSVRNFIEKYQPQQAFVVNLNYEEDLFLGKTKISFIPYYRLFQLKI
jgi:uncharacterized protein